MILAMILAHLVGDFILQTDRIAFWKSRELKGVLVHGLVILTVTWLFALPFDPTWWQGILFISIMHTAIDASWWYFKPALNPLLRFLVDQFLHFTVIFVALGFGGFIDQTALQGQALSETELIMVYALGYALITMPAWVLLKFVGYWFLEGTAPVFPDTFHKYAGILERVLVLTFVITGQFLLVPLLAVPRLFLERKQLRDDKKRPLILFESLAGIALAVGVGLILRAL